jgi:hypothetical protein
LGVVLRVVKAFGKPYLCTIAHGGIESVSFQNIPFFGSDEVNGGEPDLSGENAEVAQGNIAIGPAADGVADVSFSGEWFSSEWGIGDWLVFCERKTGGSRERSGSSDQGFQGVATSGHILKNARNSFRWYKTLL